MTPEQQAAVANVRDLLAEMPAQPSPELAASWWTAIRDRLRDITTAFPRGRCAVRLYLPEVAHLDSWLDENVAGPYKAQPLAQNWARISKIGEEYGEAVQALIGCTGQNPRKGHTHRIEDVLNELADTFITCLLAIQHFTKDEGETTHVIEGRWAYRVDKAVLPDAPDGAP